MPSATESSLTGVKGLVFDCDGVMIDSLDANRYFYNTILAALDLPPMTPEQEKYAFMASAREALLVMVPPALHAQIDKAAASSMNYARDVLPRIRLMPGLRKFLEIAKKRGLRMGIDTNRTAEGIQRVLDFFDLQEYFDPVISSSIAPPKPLPEGALTICHAWRLTVNAALFIGDSENDMLTAQGAGIPFAAFKNRDLEAAAHISSYAQLEAELWP